ncbi:MAG: hypothetical protein ABSC19_13300 [Syntrophorhabdales bacterium]|jgi:Rod binding domain-containing protein
MDIMDSGVKIAPLSMVDLSAAPASAGKQQSMEKAAEGFESFFIFTMLKELENATHLTEKSYAEQTEMSIFYEKVADYLAKRGIGIKEVIMKYLERKG